MKKYIAELLGTFCLIFSGTGAIIVHQETGGTVTHVGICIVFGLIVTAMIYAFGNISGAHINPAVTVSFWVAGLFPAKEILPYIISQTIGAFLATGLLRLMFPENEGLGGTYPSGSDMQSFVMEVVLTFMLMLVVLFTSQGSKEVGVLAGLAIGGVVLLEALFAGPISGASMNPIRSLAPAIVAGKTSQLWVYLAAPTIGALLATFTWNVMKEVKAE